VNISERDFVLLQQIQRAQRDGLLNLEALAAHLGVSASALVRRLKVLQDAGWIERRQESLPHGRAVFYVPLPCISVQWVSPRHGTALSWSGHGEMDWDFPLTSQVPDAPARETLRRLLRALRDKGLLHEGAPFPDEAPASGGGTAVVVYGSVARGTARPDSDLDLLVVTDGRAEKMADIATDVSMESPRPLQATFIAPAKLQALPKEIHRALSEDGLVVFDSLHDPALWRAVYGKR
jgi:hypothetical protein